MTKGAPGLWLDEKPLLLASGSAARKNLLDAAGIPLEIVRPGVNEKAIAATLLESRATPPEIAVALAHAKAEAAARRHPARLVLAADQTLDHAGRLFMKPVDLAQARAQLERLRGAEHQLHSAAVLRRDDTVLWAGIASATLMMRPFSDAFAASYLGLVGATALETVGAYQLEALGVHLFAEIVGDHATILGLPLYGVLQALRDQGVLRA